jgi:phosphoenolpyruvate carboxylase
MGQVSNWVELIRWIFASVLWRRWRKKGSLVGRRRLVMPGMDQPLNSEKDIPLREDIRLLGRILGDTVRSQEGDAVFDIIEGIRRSSIRFRRDEDQVARRELEAALNRLSRDETIQIIRAFSYFSHLANIAEDQHHIRRTRAHVGVSAPREGSIAHALARAQRAGIARSALQRFFASALICPVLTAHPTEVRRKSTIDREMEVAALLAERDRIRLTAEEERATEEALARAVLILWQTSILRRTRLKVVDEVANGLSYYDYTFLRELPGVYAEIEDQLAKADPAWDATELPTFLHMGSWIGGDRDGNPFVTAEVLHQALRMQSRRALSFYLDELHLLGGELSLDARERKSFHETTEAEQ